MLIIAREKVEEKDKNKLQHSKDAGDRRKGGVMSGGAKRKGTILSNKTGRDCTIYPFGTVDFST